VRILEEISYLKETHYSLVLILLVDD